MGAATALKDVAFLCYCAYVLRISRYSGFLWVVPSNKEIFLRGLKLCGETSNKASFWIQTLYIPYLLQLFRVIVAKICFSRIVINRAKILRY